MSNVKRSTVVAALLMCAAMLSFTVLDTIFKILVVHYGAPILVTVRQGVQVVAMLALVPWLGRRVLRCQQPMVQFGRGLCLIAGSGLAALSLRYLPMAQTYAIGFSAPLMAALIAVPMMGEHMGWRQAICILFGFAGVVLALDPGAPSFGIVLMLPLLLALSNAALHVLTRFSRAEDPLASVLWSAVASASVCTLALPWTFETMAAADLALLVAGGIAGTLGQLLMFEAFRRAPTAVVSPIAYSQFIWTTISGALVFGEIPGVAVIAGAIAVAVSGVALVRWATPATPPIVE